MLGREASRACSWAESWASYWSGEAASSTVMGAWTDSVVVGCSMDTVYPPSRNNSLESCFQQFPRLSTGKRSGALDDHSSCGMNSSFSASM